jgi:hypothetical protein
VVATPHSGQLTRVPARRQVTRRWNVAVRRVREADVTTGLLLLLVCMAVGWGIVRYEAVPVTTMLIPLIIGNLLLGPRSLPWFVVSALGILVVAVSVEPDQLDGRRIGGIIVSFAGGLIILVSSFRRSRLGVAGARGESMLVDLRDRISKQSQIPELPQGWYGEAVMRSAGGSSFAGDFIVAAKPADNHLEVAVVDVSGKGEQAGTRALLLSGAFSARSGSRASPPRSTSPWTWRPVTSRSAPPVIRRRCSCTPARDGGASTRRRGPSSG